MRFGLCVVGCGQFAREFAGAAAELHGEVDLFFASRDLDRAQAYNQQFQGAGAFGSYQEAARDDRVEALYICTPHHLHLEHCRLAARHGKHILLEKPISRTLEEGWEVISIARDAGVVLMVAENYRFLSAVQDAKGLIDSGLIGRVRLIQLQEEFPFAPGSWRNSKENNGGGVFIDGGIHKASVLSYLAGRPNEIYAAEVPSAQPGLDAEDGIVVMTRSAEGAVGVINHSWSISQPIGRPWVSVGGSEGNLNFELGRAWVKYDDGSGPVTRQLRDEYRGVAPMVREFHASIRDKREPAMPGEEALADLNLVLTAYESMRSGMPVPLDWRPWLTTR